MNLFQKYGIKEIADVVFYSITPVGDEEFYTPVLYLDTLKVSTIEKSAEKVMARGGKGNKKLITWNFGKEITLNLEDALFSPASMSMIWGGKLNAKLSDYTSAIVKCNIANKYGEQHFSTKAYPSPALTEEEWEIIYNAAQDAGYVPLASNKDNGANYNIELPGGSENRKNLQDEYFKRNRYTMLNSDFTFNVKIHIGASEEDRNKPENQRDGLVTITNYSNYRTLTVNFGSEKKELFLWDANIRITDLEKDEVIADTFSYNMCQYEEGGEVVIGFWNNMGGLTDTIYTSSSANSVYGVFYEVHYDSKNTPQDFETYVKQKDLMSVDSSLGLTQAAIPKKVIEKVMEKIDELKKVGEIETDIHDLEVIDRMEKCIVKKKEGQKISVTEQKENLFRYYLDDKTSSYTIYYDAKTMLPLLRINENGEIESWSSKYKAGKQYTETYTISRVFENEDQFNKTLEEYKNNPEEIYKKGHTKGGQGLPENAIIINYGTPSGIYLNSGYPVSISVDIIFEVTDTFTIKLGTVYYKWTRTVKHKEYEDDDILGRTLVIDAETFPETYRIVGETYIRNQKTGKDQRYQFTIFNAAVSSDTSITLQAEGDPTTFSMQIDVLTPPNDIQMELKQFDVEDDLLEGGTRIVSQSSKYSYTPTNVEEVIIDETNEEIY